MNASTTKLTPILADPKRPPASPDPGPQTVTLLPSIMTTSAHTSVEDNSDSIYCGPDPRGLGSLEPAPGEALVGYDRYWDGGSDPFPCWLKDDHAYRAAVEFDLARLNAMPRKLVLNATLKFHSTCFPCPLSAGLLTANSPWESGASDLIPGDLYRDDFGYGSTNNSLDVTQQVNRWLAFPESNHGFVLAQGTEDYPKYHNETVLAHLTNVSLQITVLPLN
jgi:hypothetical protein